VRKGICYVLLVFLLGVSVHAKESNWNLFPKNTVSLLLPSTLDSARTTFLTNTLQFTASYKGKHTLELQLPLTLVFYSDLKAYESRNNTKLFISRPYVELTQTIGQNKLSHSFSFSCSFPVHRSAEAEALLGKDNYHRMGLLYNLRYMADPVAFATGIGVISSVPYRENGHLMYELPKITVPSVLVFSINKTISLRAVSTVSVQFPEMSDGELVTSEVIFDLKLALETMLKFDENHISVGLNKTMSNPFAKISVYVSYGHDFAI